MKAQMVDYYAQILSKVLGNEMDAHISWKTNFGFCCELDDDCVHEFEGVPENKDYGGDAKSAESTEEAHFKTKRLFVRGLSFYTSEKTLRAAFESFGDLVWKAHCAFLTFSAVKDYAFTEYTTEKAAGAALKEMNGKVIIDWMIVFDVAKTNQDQLFSTDIGGILSFR